MKPVFEIIDLGTLPGGSTSHAVALNNRGQVAGWDGYAGSPFFQVAWIWQEGVISALAMPMKGLTSNVRDINDWGQMIGQTKQLIGDHQSSDDGSLKALHVGQFGTMLGNKGNAPFLPFLVRDERAEFFGHSEPGRVLLQAINNKGHVLGWLDTFYQDEPDRPPRKTRKSFLWREGQFTEIAAADSGKFQAYGLNDLGQVVGRATSPDGEHGFHAWLWHDGQLTALGTLGGYSIPQAINASGQIVGVSQSDEDGEENPVHGFLWENGTMINLDGTSEVQESRPLAINRHGQIVGQSNTEDDQTYGFLWHDGQMHNLNELVAPGSNWDITEAVSINDLCQIACNAQSDGVSHALLLTPLSPE